MAGQNNNKKFLIQFSMAKIPMLIIKSMGNASNIINSVFTIFFIPPPALNDNLQANSLLMVQLISKSLSASSVARRLLYSYVNNTGKPVKAVFGGVKALTNCSGNDAYLSICLDDVEQNRVPLKTDLYTIVPLELIVPTGSTLLIYTNWGGSSHSEVVWSLSGILNVYRC